MKEISNVAKIVQPSPIRKMFNLADGMEDVVSFTVGEPDFNTPAHVVDAAVEALRTGKHHYTPNAGILPLREAISEYYGRSRGLHYSPETEIIATAGGMEALLLTMLTLLNPGDAFLLSDPCWTNYSRQIEICSARPVFVPVDAAHDFTFAPEALETAITPATKGILVNSPANPTGGMAGRKALEQLAEIAVRHDLYVISDEVYSELLYEGNTFTSIAALPGMKERTIIVNSFSKTYAMTGWRVGFLVAHEEIIKKCSTLQGQSTSNICSIAQKAALAALTGPMDCEREMREAFSRRRNMALSIIDTWKFAVCPHPDGAFYLFIDVHKCFGGKVHNSLELSRYLLERLHIATTPGVAFGNDICIRLSYAVSDDALKKALTEMGEVLAELADEA